MFARADTQRAQPVDVNRVITSAINMAWNEIRHRARLERSLGEVAPVEAAEGKLGQVFLNLLVNAAQAIPEGAADRNVIAVRTCTDAGQVHVEIRDSGAGISPENMEHLFEPFFTTKPADVGTGLGLSICRGIVTGLGGDITVQSTPGSTVFRVSLPAAASREAPRPVARPAAQTSRRARVLVIDDEPLVARALQRTLRLEHEVVAVGHGAEGLQVLESGQVFDIIFCDLMMPVLSGMEFFAELKQRDPQAASRVVFLMGGAFTPAARDFLASVPNRRLEKPWDPQTLRSLIHELLTAAVASATG